ncbi:armadillo-type protein [Dichotomocladium elegans]|nr:armadillo-type protein [Dichotomocladium elegans]
MNAFVDANGQCNVALLDQTVSALNQGNPASHSQAQAILAAFQSWDDAWHVVDQILERSSIMQTKFIALGILDRFIVAKWKKLPIEQRLAIRNFIAGAIVACSGDKARMISERPYLNKLNMVLVQIVKKEWPEEWPTFITEIVTSAQADMNICENNMIILRLLSEEVFDASEEKQARWKTDKLKSQMVAEFDHVLALGCEVLQKVASGSLVINTLDSLLRFLSWLPGTAIFETELISVLCARLEPRQQQPIRNLVLRCFSEIVGRRELVQGCEMNLVSLDHLVMRAAHQIIPAENDIGAAYDNADSEDQAFIYHYAFFLTQALTTQKEIIASLNQSVYLQALTDLLRLSRINENEIWNTCLDYWVILTSELCTSSPFPSQVDQAIFKELRRIIPEKMTNPDKTVVIDDDDDGGGGSALKFEAKSGNIGQYEAIKKLLCNLTMLGRDDMKVAVLSSLRSCQNDGAFISAQKLLRTTWVVGAISGVMPEAEEQQFIEHYMKELDTFSRANRNVAIVCMLHLSGHYPQVLIRHRDFLKQTLGLILECLHDKEASIRSMAYHTFNLVCSSCKSSLALADAQGCPILLQELLGNISSLVTDLESQQIAEIYRGVSYIFSATSPEYKQKQMAGFMEAPNQALRSLVVEAQHPNLEALKMFTNLIRINMAVCTAMGPEFCYQLQSIYPDLIRLYQRISQPAVSSALMSKKCNEAKCCLKTLVRLFIDSDPDMTTQNQHTINALVEVCMTSPPEESDVADLLSSLIEYYLHHQENSMRHLYEMTFLQVFERIFLDIRYDFTSHYEKRPSFYGLVKTLVSRGFKDLMAILPQEKFTLLVESILWGVQHPDHAISNQALDTLNLFLDHVADVEGDEEQNTLYALYYMQILHTILHTITDLDRRTQFELQSKILARLVDLVQQGEIYTRLYQDGFGSNAEFVQGYIRDQLREIYPLLPEDQIDLVAQGMLEYSDDIAKFRSDLVDFMADFRSSDDFSNVNELATVQEAWQELA